MNLFKHMSPHARTRLVVFVMAFALIGSYVVIKSFAATPNCTTTLNSGSSISSALSSASAGSTICLNAGTYSYSTNKISKSTMTTIKAANGVTASQITLTGGVDLQDSNNLSFEGITIAGMSLGKVIFDNNSKLDQVASAPATNISIKNSIFSGGLCVNEPNSTPNLGIVIDGNTFNGLNNQACGKEGRLSVNGNIAGSNTAGLSHGSITWHNGITISNNTIGNGGCSDGIQIAGEAVGVDIINNNFVGIIQGSCAPVHADPLQLYGAHYTTIEGNIFNNNSTGIMTVDGNGNPSNVINNVFLNNQPDNYSSKIICGGCSGWKIDHNTFVGGAQIRLGKINTSSFSTNMTVTNNVVTGGFNLTEGETLSNVVGSTGGVNYNMSSDSNARGANGVNATPTYTSSSPVTHDDYILKPGTSGSTSASDGTAIGVSSLSAGGNTASQNTANLWVDTNGGTCTRSATPAAYSDASACTWQAAYTAAQSNDSIVVKGGAYGNVKLRNNRSGLTGVTFTAASNESITMTDFDNGDYQDPGVSNVTFKGPYKTITFSTDGTSNVTVDGWEADCSTCTTAGQAQMFHGESTTNLTVKNSSIHDSHAINPSGGMTYVSGTNLVFDNVEFYNAAVNDTSVHSECMYVASLSGDPGITIKRSRFYHCSYEDVFFGGSQYVVNGVFENNVFERDWSGYPSGSVRNIQAIKFRDSTSDPLTPDIGNVKLSYNTFRGVVHFGSQNNGANSNLYVGPLVAEGNIFLSAPTSCFSGTNAVWRYNAHVSGGCGGTGTVVDSGLISTTNFTDVSTDPGDWHLKSTATKLIDNGNPASYPALDKDGNNRTGTPDIGAYEYGASSGGGGTTPNPADINNDGTVNLTDLSILLSNYGKTTTTGDINNDGTVNLTDLSILLSNYGQTSP